METLIIMMKVGKSMSIRISSREAKLAEGNVTIIDSWGYLQENH